MDGDGVDPLSDVEVRVLGALIEKDITTPDYYPLSLNALVNACNQKNNRDPVMHLQEDAVQEALSTLQDKRLAGPTSIACRKPSTLLAARPPSSACCYCAVPKRLANSAAAPSACIASKTSLKCNPPCSA